MGKKRKNISQSKHENGKSDRHNIIRKSVNKIIPTKESLNYRKMAHKKIAVSFKCIYKTFSLEQIKNFSFEQLKINASIFDLNPLINFKLLSQLHKNDLTEYNKYIIKYKYTLNYDDAKKLGCFAVKEKEIIEECQNNFKIAIKKIKSLSKLKLFNFLFYIINLEFNNKDGLEIDFIKRHNEIKEKIKSYKSDINLIFKIPNNYGNYELQYYTYLDLFIDYFYRKITPKNKDNYESNSIKLNEDDVYFNWDKTINGKYEYINVTQFEDNKKELSKFLFENNIKNEKNNKIDKKNEKEKEDNNESNLIINKDYEYTISQNLFDFFKNQAAKLKMFKDELFFLFREQDDIKILKQIEFIYYSLLFTNDFTYKLYDIYSYCLYNNPAIKNENYEINFYAVTSEEKRDSINKEELVFYNLDKYFEEKRDNPFCNNAKYFKYPILLKKNVFQFNQNSFELFRNFLKEVYKSKLLEEIYYLTPEFNDFRYPLKDDEILEEMIDNTVFLPYDRQILCAYAEKQFSKIYIATKLLKEDYFQNDLSKILIEISFIINSLIREQFKNYINMLLFYNSFRFKKNKRLNSNISGFEQEKLFIDKIRLKYSVNKNVKLKPVIDIGYKEEIYLYGKVLNQLYLSGALFLFDKKSWDLPYINI